MTHEKRETAGKINLDLLPKAVDDTHCAVEQSDEQLKEYELNFFECLADGKQKYGTDFYIVVIMKREKLLTRVIRTTFLARRSCPTPHFDESVFRYIFKEDRIQYLWTLPDIETANYLVNNYLMLDPVERQVADFVLKYTSNELLYTAMKLNNEFPENEVLKSFTPTII